MPRGDDRSRAFDDIRGPRSGDGRSDDEHGLEPVVAPPPQHFRSDGPERTRRADVRRADVRRADVKRRTNGGHGSGVPGRMPLVGQSDGRSLAMTTGRGPVPFVDRRTRTSPGHRSAWFGRVPTRPGVRAFARGVPPQLSAAWLAISPLYVLGRRGLPEPMVALLVSTAIGVFSAAVLALVTVRVGRPPPDEVPHVPDPGRPGPAVMPFTPTNPSSRSTGGSVTEVRRDRSTSPPVVVPSSRTGAQFDGAQFDGDRYPSVRWDETQCPRCGSFAVAPGRIDGSVDAGCGVCCFVWPVGDGLAHPDVIVRSWLSRENPTSTVRST